MPVELFVLIGFFLNALNPNLNPVGPVDIPQIKNEKCFVYTTDLWSHGILKYTLPVRRTRFRFPLLFLNETLYKQKHNNYKPERDCSLYSTGKIPRTLKPRSSKACANGIGSARAPKRFTVWGKLQNTAVLICVKLFLWVRATSRRARVTTPPGDSELRPDGPERYLRVHLKIP